MRASGGLAARKRYNLALQKQAAKAGLEVSALESGNVRFSSLDGSKELFARVRFGEGGALFPEEIRSV